MGNKKSFLREAGVLVTVLVGALRCSPAYQARLMNAKKKRKRNTSKNRKYLCLLSPKQRLFINRELSEHAHGIIFHSASPKRPSLLKSSKIWLLHSGAFANPGFI